MRPLPRYDQVLQLPCGPRMRVPAEYGDSNGHLNVRHHLGIYDDAEWALFEPLGLGDEHARLDLGGIFALEQHLTYRREVLVGDDVSVQIRFAARTDRLLHLVSYLANHTREEVAGSMEALNGYVDLRTRRLSSFPQSSAAGLDALIVSTRQLSWQPVLSGSIELQ
jgi:acyl-CoA thioester hydrolase